VKKIEAESGENTYAFYKRVIQSCYIGKCKLKSYFNGIEVIVSVKSYVDDLVTIYNLKSDIRFKERN
jgi:hypothetical protein